MTAVALAARASSIAVSTACVAVNTTVVAAASPPTGATADWCPSCAVPLLFFADGCTANELFGLAASDASTRCHATDDDEGGRSQKSQRTVCLCGQQEADGNVGAARSHATMVWTMVLKGAPSQPTRATSQDAVVHARSWGFHRRLQDGSLSEKMCQNPSQAEVRGECSRRKKSSSTEPKHQTRRKKIGRARTTLPKLHPASISTSASSPGSSTQSWTGASPAPCTCGNTGCGATTP